MKGLTKIIQSRGYDVAEFARLVLGQKYKTFWVQVNKGTMRYTDIVKILKALNVKFEDLGSTKKRNFKGSKIKTSLKNKDLNQIKKEQDFAKEFSHKIKEPYSDNLLQSILKEERKLSLKEFCKTYNIKEL